MKTAVLVGDGMGDYPVESLDGKTPLQAARLPLVRALAAAGEVLHVRTVGPGMTPGSDVANLSLLGYDPAETYTGRAPIEAAGAGVPLGPTDTAFRCNLVTVEDGCMRDYSAGHITTGEADELLASLRAAVEREGLRLHTGVGYRHLLVWRRGPVNVTTRPPHDIADKPVEPHQPAGERADEVRALMDASRRVFRDHPVNLRRLREGHGPATQIWLWGQGRAAALPTYPELYGLHGGVVTAVDLVRGLGRLAGLKAERIPGATGFLDTDYDAKVTAALEILEKGDFVYVHLEAPDECGHLGDARRKVEAIEAFERRIVSPVWDALNRRGESFRVVVCTDHRTPVAVRGHTAEPVPLLIVDGPRGLPDAASAFDEEITPGEEPEPAFAVMRRRVLAR
jgi:2,3-bisphosphoglycerate-independent phosphoglycerate mutase